MLPSALSFNMPSVICSITEIVGPSYAKAGSSAVMSEISETFSVFGSLCAEPQDERANAAITAARMIAKIFFIGYLPPVKNMVIGRKSTEPGFKQFFGIFCFRRGHNAFGLAGFNYLSRPHDRYAVAYARNNAEVVRDEHHRYAEAPPQV